MSETNQLWKGRSSGKVEDITVAIGQSIDLDIRLYNEDIDGSLAHAKMLARIGVLTNEERDAITGGLETVRSEITAGKMELRPELEDIHTHVENRLIELIGESAKKLHTGRSRNDQVALDTHLFVRRACRRTARSLHELCTVLHERAGEQIDTVLPGYTHLQVAQPVRLSHHLLAHFWSFLRDLERFEYAFLQAGRLPLGSGAMAGVNYPTDREFVRAELDFESIYPNSMDAVATRDHILTYLFAAATFAGHASRVAEEIIVWNSLEFGFISLPDGLTTGSSIMPQKKNPDLAELIRGKTGRIQANLMNVMTAVKGLPLTYNRDLQEDRWPLLDTDEQLDLILRALTAMYREMTFQPERMRGSLEAGFATATDLADALVSEKNVPFREAHHIAGRLVALCAEGGHTLTTAPAELRASVHHALADDAFYAAAVDMARSTDKKISPGGTARERQSEQLAEARRALESFKA